MQKWTYEHIFVWTGVDINNKAAARVGYLINEKQKNNINSWEAVNERILKVELKYKTHIETIRAVYGPSEDEKADKKEEFWQELSLTLDSAKGRDFIVGDFNGRVGKHDNIYNTIIGKYGEETVNNNGKRLINFCQNYDLIITNTFYQHKQIHKSRTKQK